MGNGKSFRTSKIDNLIREGNAETVVFGQVYSAKNRCSIGLKRNRKKTEFKIDGSAVDKRADLINIFPTVAITPNSHEFLEIGPRIRRKYLDWGVFHVEPSFLMIWQEYQRVLKQRNQLLLNNEYKELASWDTILAKKAIILENLRKDYLQTLQPLLAYYSQRLLPGLELQFSYVSGRDNAEDYYKSLRENVVRDRKLGYTLSGPHRADIEVCIGEKKAAERISRGQQKLLVYIFVLAQIKHLQNTRQKAVSLLLDDLGAELDQGRLRVLFSLLEEEFTQVFITATDFSLFDGLLPEKSSMFHVKHGKILLKS